MRYAQIRKMDISNGLGVGVSLFVQGCHFHCKDCFNSETWDFDGGKLFGDKEYNSIIDLIKKKHITRFSILGGEPFEKRNLFDLEILIDHIKELRPDIKIWIYTGYTLEELLLEHIFGEDKYRVDVILRMTDFLVDGNFQEDKKDLTYPFAGSTNQRIIDVQKTIKERKVVLLDL